jgi:hypothetical protein
MCSMKHEAKNNNRQISPTGLNLMRETITYNIYVIYENLLLFCVKTIFSSLQFLPVKSCVMLLYTLITVNFITGSTFKIDSRCLIFS